MKESILRAINNAHFIYFIHKKWDAKEIEWKFNQKFSPCWLNEILILLSMLNNITTMILFNEGTQQISSLQHRAILQKKITFLPSKFLIKEIYLEAKISFFNFFQISFYVGEVEEEIFQLSNMKKMSIKTNEIAGLRFCGYEDVQPSLDSWYLSAYWNLLFIKMKK